MATTAVDRVFVDTNVLVFADVATAPLHAIALQALRDLSAAGAELWLSRQVLREYLATLTRPQSYAAPQPPAVLTAQVVQFQTKFQVAEGGSQVTTRLLALLAAVPIGGKQVHDANIVATMLEYTIPKLLTHNTADFARFSSYITVLPLVP
jgi:predicted nucleic acid-binding protein